MADTTNAFQNLRKSSKGKVIAGVCAGLGEHTQIPTWAWRAIFLILLLATGIGLIAYIALWIFMPPATD